MGRLLTTVGDISYVYMCRTCKRNPLEGLDDRRCIEATTPLYGRDARVWFCTLKCAKASELWRPYLMDLVGVDPK